ncbi:hypothetical protein B0H14DRAFT_3460817 [Mycena olivaceomarginata]|nr:hypothetical protein B0H14DRAFT_3460817 [Mycena olivaceomarginata]
MAMTLQDRAATTKTTSGDGKDKVDLYLGNISPVTPDFDDPLGWWKAPDRQRPPSFAAICRAVRTLHDGVCRGCCAARCRHLPRRGRPTSAAHWPPLLPATAPLPLFIYS